MAKYTMELGTLIQRNYPLNLNSYPIFDESYRNTLNNKIVTHYYFREIGLPTPDKFNFYLGMRMNEIMPYYNKLYESELIKFDPLITNLTTTNEKIDFIQNGKINEKSKTAVEGGNDNTINEKRETTFKGNQKDVTEYKDTKNMQEGTENTTEHSGTITDDTEHSGTITDKVEHDGTITNASENSGQDVTKRDDNLTTSNKNQTEGTGSNITTGSKVNIESDLPQSQLDINIPTSDTSTWIATGYATTCNSDFTSQSDNTTTTEKAWGEVANTGDQTTTLTHGLKTTETQTFDNSDTTTRTLNNEDKNTRTFDNKDEFTENKKGVNETTGNEEITHGQDNIEAVESGIENKNLYDETTETEKGSEENKTHNQTNVVTFEGRSNRDPSELLKSYRESFLNIDMMIIADLENLFMGVY